MAFVLRDAEHQNHEHFQQLDTSISQYWGAKEWRDTQSVVDLLQNHLDASQYSFENRLLERCGLSRTMIPSGSHHFIENLVATYFSRDVPSIENDGPTLQIADFGGTHFESNADLYTALSTVTGPALKISVKMASEEEVLWLPYAEVRTVPERFEVQGVRFRDDGSGYDGKLLASVGVTSKTENSLRRGCKGEGAKVSCTHLLRNGISVVLASRNSLEAWTAIPEFIDGRLQFTQRVFNHRSRSTRHGSWTEIDFGHEDTNPVIAEKYRDLLDLRRGEGLGKHVLDFSAHFAGNVFADSRLHQSDVARVYVTGLLVEERSDLLLSYNIGDKNAVSGRDRKHVKPELLDGIIVDKVITSSAPSDIRLLLSALKDGKRVRETSLLIAHGCEKLVEMALWKEEASRLFRFKPGKTLFTEGPLSPKKARDAENAGAEVVELSYPPGVAEFLTTLVTGVKADTEASKAAYGLSSRETPRDTSTRLPLCRFSADELRQGAERAKEVFKKFAVSTRSALGSNPFETVIDSLFRLPFTTVAEDAEKLPASFVLRGSLVEVTEPACPSRVTPEVQAALGFIRYALSRETLDTTVQNTLTFSITPNEHEILEALEKTRPRFTAAGEYQEAVTRQKRLNDLASSERVYQDARSFEAIAREAPSLEALASQTRSLHLAGVSGNAYKVGGYAQIVTLNCKLEALTGSRERRREPPYGPSEYSSSRHWFQTPTYQTSHSKLNDPFNPESSVKISRFPIEEIPTLQEYPPTDEGFISIEALTKAALTEYSTNSSPDILIAVKNGQPIVTNAEGESSNVWRPLVARKNAVYIVKRGDYVLMKPPWSLQLTSTLSKVDPSPIIPATEVVQKTYYTQLDVEHGAHEVRHPSRIAREIIQNHRDATKGAVTISFDVELPTGETRTMSSEEIMRLRPSEGEIIGLHVADDGDGFDLGYLLTLGASSIEKKLGLCAGQHGEGLKLLSSALTRVGAEVTFRSQNFSAVPRTYTRTFTDHEAGTEVMREFLAFDVTPQESKRRGSVTSVKFSKVNREDSDMVKFYRELTDLFDPRSENTGDNITFCEPPSSVAERGDGVLRIVKDAPRGVLFEGGVRIAGTSPLAFSYDGLGLSSDRDRTAIDPNTLVQRLHDYWEYSSTLEEKKELVRFLVENPLEFVTEREALNMGAGITGYTPDWAVAFNGVYPGAYLTSEYMLNNLRSMQTSSIRTPSWYAPNVVPLHQAQIAVSNEPLSRFPILKVEEALHWKLWSSGVPTSGQAFEDEMSQTRIVSDQEKRAIRSCFSIAADEVIARCHSLERKGVAPPFSSSLAEKMKEELAQLNLDSIFVMSSRWDCFAALTHIGSGVREVYVREDLVATPERFFSVMVHELTHRGTGARDGSLDFNAALLLLSEA
jgi:hypothetical protein